MIFIYQGDKNIDKEGSREKKKSHIPILILLVVIMIVIFFILGTLYMMIPTQPPCTPIIAMDGNSTRLEDKWIIEISSGNVPFNNGEDFRLYDRITGESFSPTGEIPEDNPTAGVGFEYHGTVYEVFFNDNDGNRRVNSGDSIVIVDPDGDLEELELRITMTNLRVTL